MDSITWTTHKDNYENHAEDPFKFDPTRFLDSNGGLKRNKNMFQFGFGRRSCPGQAIAELQILIFTVNLLRYVKIEHSHTAQFENF